MNRRGILRAALGLVVAPAVGVNQAAAALGVSTAIGVSGPRCEVEAVNAKETWKIGERLRTAQYAAERPVDAMPPHIRGKKSWSDVYKSSVFAREQEIIEAYIQRIQKDDAFAQAAARAMGMEWVLK